MMTDSDEIRAKHAQAEANGRQDGAIGSVDSLHAKEHAEWKRRQAIQPSAGTWLSPTLPERINRLNPSERHQLSSIIRSMKLRKIIKRTLAEAFWQREERKTHDSMQQLRAMLKARESLTSYERALTGSVDITTFDLHETRAGVSSIHSAVKEIAKWTTHTDRSS